MAMNFLIALASALGSAALILLVLRIVLKFVAPHAFGEMIPIPQSMQIWEIPHHDDLITYNFAVPHAFQNIPPAFPLQQSIILDTGTLLALSGADIAAALKNEGQPSLFIVSDAWGEEVKKRAYEQKKKATSLKEVLSPPGQSRLGYLQ
jgi:hypothetical protein